MDRIVADQVDSVPGGWLGVMVNGSPLEAVLAAHTSIPKVARLVPAWLDWWAPTPVGRSQRAWVEARSTLRGDAQVLPVLLCPEDFDFGCTVLVTEVQGRGDTVRWDRFGFDPTGRGARVEWIPEVPAFDFDRGDYLRCRDAFGAPAHARTA